MQNFQDDCLQAYAGHRQISVKPCDGVMPIILSAMATAKHDAIRGSAKGRRTRGAADERRGRGGLAPHSSSADTMIDPSQQVVNTKRAGVLLVSARACCFTIMVPV